MKYGIFQRKITTASGGVATISFTSLPNPADMNEHLILEAGNDPEAANKAYELLKLLGAKMHSTEGNAGTVLADFPTYFVGRFAVELADQYDSRRLLYQIDTFTPVPHG